MTMMTARHKLPLIVPGQAQKEMFHNESLAAIDALIAPVVEAVGATVVPPDPGEGESWIVGPTAPGAWEGKADCLATWTSGGWRFQEPTERMRVTVRDSGLVAEWTGAGWQIGEIAAARLFIGGQQVVGARREPIADATGGATVDMEARVAIAAMLTALRGHGLID